MTTQILADSISLTVHQNTPVITTELLANLYGTDAAYIRKNHHRNADRFVEGKHYYKVMGGDLNNLRMSLRHSQNSQPSLGGLQISPKVRTLILWTERGAARHAKMLETDQAWEVFEKLEDCYFNQAAAQQEHNANPPRQKICITLCGDKIIEVEKIEPDMYVGKIENILSGLRERGWVVIPRDTLVEKLAAL